MGFRPEAPLAQGETQESKEHSSVIQGQFRFDNARRGDYQEHSHQGEAVHGNGTSLAARMVETFLESKTAKMTFLYQDQASNHARRSTYLVSSLGTDVSSGRRKAGLLGLTTSVAMNPYEQLLTVHRYQSAQELHTGAVVASTKDTQQEAEKARIDPAAAHRVIATLLYGESIVVSQQQLAALSREGKIIGNLARWIGISRGGIDSGSLRALTNKTNEPGIFCIDDAAPTAIRGQYGGFENSRECRAFVEKVVEKFGPRDTRFEVLTAALPDPEERWFVFYAFCSNNLGALSREHAPALDWIRLVGTPEEISAAETATKK